MAFLSEAQVEQALLEQLRSLGWATASDEVIGPDGSAPERDSHDVVLLQKRLEDAVLRLNPNLPPEARADAIAKLTQSVFPALLEENRRIHTLLTEGVDVEYYGEDGVLTAGKVALLDFEQPQRNDWLAVQAMGDDKLKVIAHELLVNLKGNVSVDWAHRDSARARMRVLAKRILRKYGYPPDLQDVAIQTVLQQAEVLSAGWSAGQFDRAGTDA